MSSQTRRKRMFMIRLNEAESAQIDFIAAARGCSRSAVVRQLIFEDSQQLLHAGDAPVPVDSVDGFSKADTTAKAEFYAS